MKRTVKQRRKSPILNMHCVISREGWWVTRLAVRAGLASRQGEPTSWASEELASCGRHLGARRRQGIGESGEKKGMWRQ